MPYIINLVSSSSPNSSLKRRNSLIHPSSSINSSPLSKTSYSKKPCVALSSLSQSNPNVPRYEDCEFDKDAYERFKMEWNTRLQSPNANNLSSLSTFKAVNDKKRRASDTFNVIPFNSTLAPKPKPIKFKNKMEAMNSIRLQMSKSMAESYEAELRRRFNERQMINCVPLDTSDSLIPAEMASFRWKFAEASPFLKQRLFIIDSELIWDEFIVSGRFHDLLNAYNEPDVFLYFMNWKRAGQKHTNLLNRLFKQSVTGTETETILERQQRLPAFNELENDFFLTAAELRLQVNFGLATSTTQSLADLMDFIIEMTRVVALAAYIEVSNEQNDDPITTIDSNYSITLPRHVKVRSGKDPRDCWIKILCQIPRVTPPLADLIASRYPSFHALMEAYDCCSNVSMGEMLLSDLKQSDRKIGPVLSKRIHKHFFR